MTPVGAEDPAYVAAVLTLYLDLPDTPLRPSPLDQALARRLEQQAVPLPLVESAFLLATLRRLSRPSELPPLPPPPPPLRPLPPPPLEGSTTRSTTSTTRSVVALGDFASSSSENAASQPGLSWGASVISASTSACALKPGSTSAALSPAIGSSSCITRIVGESAGVSVFAFHFVFFVAFSFSASSFRLAAAPSSGSPRLFSSSPSPSMVYSGKK